MFRLLINAILASPFRTSQSKKSLPTMSASTSTSGAGDRAKSLQQWIDLLGVKIAAASDEIISIGREIRGLDEEKSATKIAKLEAGRSVVLAQQVTLKEQQTKAEVELAELKAESKVVFSGLAELLELIGPSLEGALPPLDQLEARLKAELSTRFPVDEHTFEELKMKCLGEGLEVDNVLRFLEASKKPFPLGKVPINWLATDFEAAVKGQSEDCLHGAITPIVQSMLGYFLDQAGSAAKFSRNEAESVKRLKTTSGALRPDFLMHIRNLLVFRGEEKKDGVDIAEAARELTSKMESWNPLFFGDIPYIFGYALAGTEFQLYALHPDLSQKDGVNPVQTLTTEICEVLHLGRAADRIRLLQYMINLVCVFQAIAKLVPSDAPMLCGVYTNPRHYSGKYSELVFETTFVRKVLLNMPASESYAFDDLQELYGLVQQGHVVNTIQCKKNYPELSNDRYGGRLMTLCLYPIGRCVLPNSAKSLELCLLAVLGALESMHKHRFCHRDVRWPNILQLANNAWMLIDLEFAIKMAPDGVAKWPFWISERPDANTWPPRNGTEGWGTAKDVWMVGQLLKDLIEPNKPDPVAGVDLNSLAAEIQNCQSCADAKAVVLRVLHPV